MAEAAKAAQVVQAAGAAQAPEATTPGSPPASSSSMKSLELTDSLVPTSGETPTLQGATGTSDSVQGAQSLPPEFKDAEPNHIPARDSANYKVPVPPSPVVSPHMGPQSTFDFLNSDPTMQRSASKRRQGPPVQIQATSQQLQAITSPQSMTSPVSPSHRSPYQRWDGEHAEFGQGQGQDHQEDGDHEDEGGNYDTDGDALSGPEDQGERRRRPRPGADGHFTPTRSAPLPPNIGGLVPNSREAEIAHIMYIQQQQALFLQERALNPPLKGKSSNGNLSGNEGGSKIRRKLSHHRKIQISSISEPTLVSTTNQVKTVPIVRPADQSDNEDAGQKSEHASGGEGIKKTVRRMRKAVRHAANGVFHDDDSDREEAVGSKSDVEKKGGLKQLKALKSKLAKKLNRPERGGASSKHDQDGGAHDREGADNSRGPVQFFSEDNLRARYLAQENEGGSSFAAVGASLRRSNTTRDSNAASGTMYNLRAGGKEEYESGGEQDTSLGDILVTPASPTSLTVPEDRMDAAAKARLAKLSSRTFDNDEMIEVRDGNGESFFVPRWDQDPKELDSSKTVTVINVQSKKKASIATKSLTAITEIAQATVAEGEVESKEESAEIAPATEAAPEVANASTSEKTTTEPTANNETTVEPVTEEKAAVKADQATQDQEGPKTPTTPTGVEKSSPDQVEEETIELLDAEVDPNASASDLMRASVLSEASTVTTSGIAVAQVLTRQNSMKRDFKRKEKSSPVEHAESVHPLSEEVEETESHTPVSGQASPEQGSVFTPSPRSEIRQEVLEETMEEMMQQQSSIVSEKDLPPLPSDARPESMSQDSNPLGAMAVRPLSPIRRGSPSMLSMSSVISSPGMTPVSTSSQESLMKPALDSETSKKANLGKLSLGSSFTLPQAPTSPLPSPSLPTLTASAATPTTPVAPSGSTLPMAPIPFPAVLARQGSHLTERGSVRSMYADSIYDCYDYDSSSEYDPPAGGMSRQGSFSSTVLNGGETESAVGKPSHLSVVAAIGSTNESSTLAVSSGSGRARSSVSSTLTVTSDDQTPVVRRRSPGPGAAAGGKDESLEEQQHVQFEDLPKAVAYRMSMMKTVPIEPVGVARSMSIPSRPPRHPMRRSRQGSVNTLNSDMTTDSWLSSARYTRDDLSGWDERSELDSRDEDRLCEVTRRRSNASSLSHISYHSSGGQSDRTMSMQSRVLELSDESPLRRRASEASSVVRFPRHDSVSGPSGASGSIAKQWHREQQQRETWGSIQSLSSDSVTSESSAPSSHFYFDGRSRSPSPTEEAAPTTNAF